MNFSIKFHFKTKDSECSYRHYLGIANGNVVSASADSLIKIWDTKTFNSVATLLGHVDGVFTVVASASLSLLFSGGRDKSVRAWNATSYQLVKILTGHTDAVEGLALDANNRLASGADDRRLIIWDASVYTNVLNRASWL